MGLDLYLKWEGQTDKEHQAQITGFSQGGVVGYLRSAYNDSGVNTWLQQHTGKDGFYYIFQQDGEEDNKPDWDIAETRCKELLKKAKTAITRYPKERQGDFQYYIDVLEKEIPAFIALGREKNGICYWSG